MLHVLLPFMFESSLHVSLNVNSLLNCRGVSQTALKREKAVGALVAVLVGGSAAGKEAAAVALANLSAGSKDVAVRLSSNWHDVLQ